MKTKNEETDEAAADKAAKEESKKKPKKPEAPDAVEKAMGKAKQGHPGGIQHFRDKIMKAGKDAVKKHDEKLADEELNNEDRSPEFQKDIDDRRKRGDEESAKRLEAGEKKSDDAVAAARQKAVDKKRAEIHKRSGGKPPRMGGLTHTKPVPPYKPGEKPGKVNSSSEYRRMGLYLAEAMGFRIDELLPAVAAMAGRAVVGSVVKKVAGKALASDEDKKKKELAAQNKSAEVQEEGKAAVIKKALTKVAKNPKVRAAVLRAGSQAATSMADKEEKKTQTEGKIMNSYVKKLMEWEAGPTAKRIAAKAGDPEGRVSDTGGKIKDPLVKKEVATTQANVDKKLGVKTNLRTKDAIQGSMNRRRAAVKAGKSVEGSPRLGGETRKDAEADAYHSRKKVHDAGDQ
jgi:hypothetical protein